MKIYLYFIILFYLFGCKSQYNGLYINNKKLVYSDSSVQKKDLLQLELVSIIDTIHQNRKVKLIEMQLYNKSISYVYIEEFLSGNSDFYQVWKNENGKIQRLNGIEIDLNNGKLYKRLSPIDTLEFGIYDYMNNEEDIDSICYEYSGIILNVNKKIISDKKDTLRSNMFDL